MALVSSHNARKTFSLGITWGTLKSDL